MNWRRYFEENIIKRGEEYYRKGKVVDFFIDGPTRTATVLGRDEYVVGLTFDEDGDLTDAVCNCPYAEQGEYCKHMVAVLLAEENDGTIPLQKSRSSRGKKEKTQPIQPFRTVGIFEEYEIEPSAFKQEITKIISSYKRRGFIEYEDAYQCALDVSDETRNAVESMLSKGDYKAVFDCAFFVMRKFSGTDMDDSDGGTADVCAGCVDHIAAAIKDPTTEKYAFKKILSYLKKPADREWYAADQLEYFLLSHFDKPAFYVQKRAFLEEKIEELQGRSIYKLGEYLVSKLSLMRKAGDSEEEIRALYRQYWQYDAVEKDYVERAMERGDIKEAERVLQKLINSPYKNGLSSEYCRKKLLEIYETSGGTDKYRAVLYDFVAEEYNFGIERYFELKKLYDGGEWLRARDGLLEKIKKRNREYYPELLYKEELKERLFQFVLGEEGLRLVQKYEKYLMDDYADQLFEKYKKELNEQMARADTRDMYKDIVRTLRRLNGYEGGKTLVKALVGEWRVKYVRRRALMEELDKVIL